MGDLIRICNLRHASTAADAVSQAGGGSLGWEVATNAERSPPWLRRNTDMARIGILVVAYNAQSTLRNVIQRIPAPIMEKIEEIFVFDDASSDDTHQVGRQLATEQELHDGKLSIYRNPVNLMYGGNQRKGYEYAISRGFDIVVLLHGDGQYAPEVMQDLLTPLETGQADMVMGSRMM